MERRDSIVVLKDRERNTYSFREDNPHIVATNQIYIAEENPDIYIKVIKQPSLPEYPDEHAYIRGKIGDELKLAKTLSGNFFPVPHVYLTKLVVDPDFVTGYIVMDRIKGRIIGTQKEFERYFDKIMTLLNDLLEFEILYKDMNINNFIIGEEDDEIYLIDFEDAVPYEPDHQLILQHPDGSVSLNQKYIKSTLKESIRIRRRHRMNDSAESTPDSSPKTSPRKTKRSSPNDSTSPRKTAKTYSPNKK